MTRTNRGPSALVAIALAIALACPCALALSPGHALAHAPTQVGGGATSACGATAARSETTAHIASNDTPDALSDGIAAVLERLGQIGSAGSTGSSTDATGGQQDPAGSANLANPSNPAAPAPDTASPDAGAPREDAVQAATQAIYDALLGGRLDEVDIEGLGVTKDEFLAATDRLEHLPRCIHWKSTSYTTTNRDGVDFVISFSLNYRLDDAAVATYQSDLDAALAQLVAQVDPAASGYDKALYVYDWLANNVTYAQDIADGGVEDSIARTPLGALRDGTAVCSGYASAFKLAMEALGIECDYVFSMEMDHTWNAVNIDGTWYYADATWDDKDDGLGSQHFYFLVSEQTLARDHWGWEPLREAPADLGRPGYLRYSPDSYALADAALEVVYSGSADKVDILDYWVTGEAFDAMMRDLDANGSFYGMYFEWRYFTNEDGYVTYFTITHY